MYYGIFCRIMYHKAMNRITGKEITDELVLDLISFKGADALPEHDKGNRSRYLKRLCEMNFIAKYGNVYLINPWYYNNFTKDQRDYVLVRLKALDTPQPPDVAECEV